MLLVPRFPDLAAPRARIVTTVALAPASAARPARAAGITVSGPASPTAAADPVTAGRATLSEARGDMRGILARALDLELTESMDLTTLAGQARRAGRYDLARSAETFVRLSSAFSATAEALAAPATPNREGLVRRAISDIASARVEPQRLQRDIASLRAVTMMALTGASADDQRRALAFRRAVDAAAVAGQKRRIVQDLTRGWQSGALSVSVNRAEVGAGQSWTLDRSGTAGAQAVLVDPAGFGGPGLVPPPWVRTLARL